MPEAALVLSPTQPYPLHELARTLVHELGHQGVPSQVHTDGFPEPRHDRVYVWLDPLGYIEAEGELAVPGDSILRRTVFLYDEHRVPVDDAEHLGLARRAGAVFAMDRASQVELHRRLVPARLLRPGYSSALDHFDANAQRPIDVMFLGAHSPRRTRYLARAARVLARHPSVIQIASRPLPPGDSASFLGERKWPLLAATKVVINLHCGEQVGLEWRRTLDAIHAGAVVVTEHSSAIAPLVPGEHLLVASAESLPYVADTLLADPERLASLRAAAYERLSVWIPFALPVSVLRAALVELVGEPVGADAPRGTVARETCGPASEPPSTAPAATERSRTPTRSPGPAGLPPAQVVAETPAWERIDGPRVTALVAAAESQAASATLDALAAAADVLAAARPGAEVEIIAVRAGDAGPAARWLDDHPERAARLLAVADATMLGAARNAALAHARGELCLALDAGQALYRRGLEVLVRTLDEHRESAFAYPISEVTGDPDAFAAGGGDHLLSFAGWDPARLRAGCAVHSPALVRADLLRELGGFTTDPVLAGMEDYDLWCRIAERGGDGRLVPEILGRRSESAVSPVLAALQLADGPAAIALAARAPGVFLGGSPAAQS